MNHRRIEGVPTLGRTPPFLVEDRGDLGAIEAFPAKVGGARRQRRVSAERREARHRARQFVRCAASAMPMAFDAHLFRAPHDLDQDPFEQQARDGLALGSSCGLGKLARAPANPASARGSPRFRPRSAPGDCRASDVHNPPPAAPVRSEPPPRRVRSAAQLERTAPSSAATRYRSLQQLFKWLDDEGEIDASPMAWTRPPIIPEQPVAGPSDDQAGGLLAVCSGKDFRDRRDTCDHPSVPRCLHVTRGDGRAPGAAPRMPDLSGRGPGGRASCALSPRVGVRWSSPTETKAARDTDRYIRAARRRDSPNGTSKIQDRLLVSLRLSTYEYDLQQLELIMCQLTGIDPLAPVPPYRQIAEILKRRILSGQYLLNSRIPTESELVEALRSRAHDGQTRRSPALRGTRLHRPETGYVYRGTVRRQALTRPPTVITEQITRQSLETPRGT